MVDARQFATLPEAQRRQEITGDFAEIARLQRHLFPNRREVDDRTSTLILNVNGHGLGLATTLIEQSSGMDITDPRATGEFAEAGGKQEWLEKFWYASFESLLQAVVGAMNSGRFGDLDAARRVHYLNETTYFTAKDYLEKQGWNADLGPHMSFVARNNIDSALSAPPGEEFEIVRRGDSHLYLRTRDGEDMRCQHVDDDLECRFDATRRVIVASGDPPDPDEAGFAGTIYMVRVCKEHDPDPRQSMPLPRPPGSVPIGERPRR